MHTNELIGCLGGEKVVIDGSIHECTGCSTVNRPNSTERRYLLNVAILASVDTGELK